ncbi:hypothetical protein M0R45_009128 [Rubus argutus]|uniref:Uncharacterized protein n=1 Tax=Rubus argutus TaxID=59490 RepID=A0AAW1Y333_RUBAR
MLCLAVPSPALRRLEAAHLILRSDQRHRPHLCKFVAALVSSPFPAIIGVDSLSAVLTPCPLSRRRPCPCPQDTKPSCPTFQPRARARFSALQSVHRTTKKPSRGFP